jgi:hypothetical protein
VQVPPRVDCAMVQVKSDLRLRLRFLSAALTSYRSGGSHRKDGSQARSGYNYKQQVDQGFIATRAGACLNRPWHTIVQTGCQAGWRSE